MILFLCDVAQMPNGFHWELFLLFIRAEGVLLFLSELLSEDSNRFHRATFVLFFLHYLQRKEHTSHFLSNLLLKVGSSIKEKFLWGKIEVDVIAIKALLLFLLAFLNLFVEIN